MSVASSTKPSGHLRVGVGRFKPVIWLAGLATCCTTPVVRVCFVNRVQNDL